MKFLQSHVNDLHKCMSENGFNPDDFEYINRKGRINISLKESNNTFSYFGRQETLLDPDSMKWVNNETYDVTLSETSSKISLDSWTGVLEYFNRWLESQ
ncbi:MAG: hypothetical protein NXI20_06245 [bacterium]|nr:hypothetical protein [bacterium]